ncbi:MAG: hypothetical protein RIC55_28670 [Pirellulaceae bacterium]
MIENAEQPISAEHAARLIYKTEHPNPKQVGGVRALLLRGELRQSEKHRLTTTRAAVADYLAAESLRRQHTSRAVTDEEAQRHRTARGPSGGAKSRGGASSGATPPGKSPTSDVYLRRVYRELLGDYFRSVVMVRSSSGNSAAFQRAVLALQVGVIAVTVALIAWAAVSIWMPSSPGQAWRAAGAERLQSNDSPERRVVEHWLRANRKSAEMLDILPAHDRPGGKSIRVRFSYRRPAKKGADADAAAESIQLGDHVFVVHRGEVVRVEEPDSQDEWLARDAPP